MAINGEQVSTILPSKLADASSILKISLVNALDILVAGLGFMAADHESILSIFAIIVREAMSYGEEFGDLGDAVDYALRHPRCPDKDSIYRTCADASECIYREITTYLPDFGTSRYTGKYSFSLGDYGYVYIRLSNTLTQTRL